MAGLLRYLAHFEIMAEATMDEKWSIDKLDSSNWTTWKFAKGLWGYVDGTEVLREGTTAQVRAEYSMYVRTCICIYIYKCM